MDELIRDALFFPVALSAEQCAALSANRGNRGDVSYEAVRQHVSDAAWEMIYPATNFEQSDRAGIEDSHRDSGTMVVTVEEWDEKVRLIAQWGEEARRYCANVDYWRGCSEQAEATIAERAGISESVILYWRERAHEAERTLATLDARLRALEEFTRQSADAAMSEALPAERSMFANLLVVADPTHKLGGGRAR